MIRMGIFIKNIELCSKFMHIKGAVVECGVWKGGMIGGIAEIIGTDRLYYLFDSFEGLPEAKEIDGESAIQWQNNKETKYYYDNCSAEQFFSEECMRKAGAQKARFIKGWFNETLPVTVIEEPIAILRLDADWYDSTMDCLVNLFDKVASGGVIIFDDYYTWDGCAKAVHDFLSKRQLNNRIRQFKDSNISYIIK